MFSGNPVEVAQSQVFLEKLKKLDFEPITHQLIQSGWTHQQAIRAIFRYKMFLFLIYLYPHTLLVPTQDIDQVWHCHILHTRQYRQDCQMLFGRFIDHEPDSEGSGIADQPSLDTAFVHTQILLMQYFGEVALADTLLEQPKGIEQTQNQPQLQKLAGKEYLHLHRSACGRPESPLLMKSQQKDIAILNDF